ncbi:MAG: hypothetical protein ACP5VN_08600 [Acidobacteriota bacterium]
MRALTLAVLAGGLLGTALSCAGPSGPRAPGGATRDRAALRGLGAVALAVEPPALEPLCRKLLLTVRRPGGGGYRLSEWAPCERPQDLENLLARVLAQFLEDWRGAGAPAPSP